MKAILVNDDRSLKWDNVEDPVIKADESEVSVRSTAVKADSDMEGILGFIGSLGVMAVGVFGVYFLYNAYRRTKRRVQRRRRRASRRRSY